MTGGSINMFSSVYKREIADGLIQCGSININDRINYSGWQGSRISQLGLLLLPRAAETSN